MSLFGTDGIRGELGKSPLTDGEVRLIGRSYASFLKPAAKVLVCRDTRSSGIRLRLALCQGLMESGTQVFDMGVLTTPAAAFLAARLASDGCIVVSASHNPAAENGLKFLTGNGAKLPEKDEARVESLLASGRFRKLPGSIRRVRMVDEYVDCLSRRFTGLKGTRPVVDCANGSSSSIAPAVLSRLGIKAWFINNKPDGRNINLDCGSEHPEAMRRQVMKEKADLGIAFDGDADRALLCDEKGGLLSGDQLIGIIAIHLKKRGELPGNAVVVTHYSSFGLERSLSEHGIRVFRSDVGDRNVADELRKRRLALGGEQSGHIIIATFLPTGDGLAASLKIMQIMAEKGLKLSLLASQIKKTPQAMLNVPVARKPKLEKTELAGETRKASAELGTTGRVFVRYSGTQDLIRIMVEGESEKQINRIAQILAAQASRELGKA